MSERGTLRARGVCRASPCPADNRYRLTFLHLSELPLAASRSRSRISPNFMAPLESAPLASGDQEPTEIIARHPVLYFADGNLVVLAKAKSKAAAPSGASNLIAFRLHTSLLSLGSKVFADMFTSSAPGLKAYDGMPTVKLFDEAETIELLFLLMYGLK